MLPHPFGRERAVAEILVPSLLDMGPAPGVSLSNRSRQECFGGIAGLPEQMLPMLLEAELIEMGEAGDFKGLDRT
jgi:hypothetical protein